MKPVDALKNTNLLSWSVLLVGLQNGWATKSDVSDYAVELLSADLDGGDENIAVLAGAESLNNQDVDDLLRRLGGVDGNGVVGEKWRFARLSALREADLSEEEKIDKLQEIYADFGYPEDMTACSIYSRDSIDPLIAMSHLICNLEAELSVPPG